MPTQSSGLSDPAGSSNPPVPSEWIDEIRREMPIFDRHLTQTRGMGTIVDCFRQRPASVRSRHPMVSFAANGADAEDIVSEPPLTDSLGDQSPLGRLYAHGAKVLMIGATDASNTSLHLAEYQATWDAKRTRREGTAVVIDGARVWHEYEDLELTEDDFVRIGDAFAETGSETTGTMGQATVRVCRQREIVDFATAWMERNRCDGSPSRRRSAIDGASRIERIAEAVAQEVEGQDCEHQ